MRLDQAMALHAVMFTYAMEMNVLCNLRINWIPNIIGKNYKTYYIFVAFGGRLKFRQRSSCVQYFWDTRRILKLYLIAFIKEHAHTHIRALVVLLYEPVWICDPRKFKHKYLCHNHSFYVYKNCKNKNGKMQKRM